jgi:uncharacterized membrane protein
MKKLIFVVISFLFLSFFSLPVLAQESIDIPKEELIKAQVVEILDEGTKQFEGLDQSFMYQTVKLKFLDGQDAGKEITLEYGGQFTLKDSQKVKEGQTVVLTKIEGPNGLQYQIIDKYRINELAFIALMFLALVLLLSRLKGVGSFLGMILSLGVIIKFIVPQILAGNDPLFISIVGSIFILISTIYLAHGFSKQTTIAVVSTALTLILTGFLSVAFVNLTNLTGLASEDAFSLQFGPTATINFKGLLLGGMIIGFLGVLDDVTTGMAATVFELKKVNPRLKAVQLVSSSLNIGREHISSLVNTLVLAYAGASLPLFLFIVLNPQGYPMWFVINSEFIAEEVVRTLVGSIGLLFAVPITAVLATWVATKYKSP